MNQHLQNIAEEKVGFSFGGSWRYSEDSLVSLLPILRDSSKKRNYLLLRESDKVEVRDTGQINKIEVYNGDTKPVYIRMGEIFTGKTQERTATRSYLVMPKEKVRVDVRCVYASKGINMGTNMSSGGIVPSSIDSIMSTSLFKSRSIDQKDIWAEVGNTAQCYYSRTIEMKSNFPDFPHGDRIDLGEINEADSVKEFVEEVTPMFTDDLRGNIERFSKQINSILEKVPYFENQVGLATLDLKGVSGIECFDLKQSWKAMKDDIVKKEGEHLSKEQKESPFEYKEKKALQAVKDVLKHDFEEKVLFKSKDYRLFGIKNEQYTGEIVEFKGELLHLVIIRKS